MSIVQSLKLRRSYYAINKNLPVTENKVIDLIETITEAIPDSFNMKSSRVVVVLGEKQDILWNAIYEAFAGKVPKEKIDSFKAGAGTILYYYDIHVVESLQQQYPQYAENFPVWASQSSGMLQLSIWAGLRELGVGASLQHYNPVIDDTVRQLLQLPENYLLLAQMPFGGIVAEPEPKEKEAISKRVQIFYES